MVISSKIIFITGIGYTIYKITDMVLFEDEAKKVEEETKSINEDFSIALNIKKNILLKLFKKVKDLLYKLELE